MKLNTLNSSPKDTFILLSNNPGKPPSGWDVFRRLGGPTFDDNQLESGRCGDVVRVRLDVLRGREVRTVSISPMI